MAQEILVRIITESSEAVAGLENVKKGTDQVSDSKGKLASAQNRLANLEEKLKAAMSSSNQEIQLKKTKITEANAAALQAAQISEMQAQGVIGEKDANELLNITYNKLTESQKLLLIEQRKKTLANQAAKQSIDAQAKSELGLTSERTKQLETNKRLSKSYDQISAADKKLLIEQRKLELQLRINKKQIDLEARAALGDAEAKKILAIQTQKLTAAEMASTQAMKKGRAQSGLNNAILMETGRLASDASYGFTAIANNLSQVVSLFQSFAKTNGGVVASLKTLGASLLGPAGIIIGIQLLISFGPKLFKFFKEMLNNIGVLGEAFKDASQKVAQQNGNFEIYIRTLQSSKKSLEEQADAVEALKKEFPDFIESLKDSSVSFEDIKNNTDSASLAIELYRKEIMKLALSEAAREKIVELQSKKLQILIDRDTESRRRGFDDYEDLVRKTTKTTEKEARSISQILDDANDVQVASSRTSGQILLDTYADNFNSLQYYKSKELEEVEKGTQALLKFVDIDLDLNKKRGSDNNRLVKAFKKGRLDFEKETVKSQERLLISLVGDEKAKVIISQQSKISQLKIKQDQFKEQQKIRLDAYLKERDDDIKEAKKKKVVDLDLIKDLNASKKQAKVDYNNSIIDSEKSLGRAIVAINKETDVKLNDIDNERAIRVQQIQNKILVSEGKLQDQLSGLPKIFQREERDARIKQLEFQIGLNKSLLENFTGTEEAKRELILETRKLEYNLGKERLFQNKSDFEQIKQIYSDGFSALEGFGTAFNNIETNNLEKRYAKRIKAAKGNVQMEEALEKELAEKKDKIAKKQFRIEQVAKISRALMDTYQTGYRAFGSQILIGDPSSPLRAKLAQAFAIANGLAQVAVIASQKYESPNMGGGGGSGGGSGVQAPDINLVGSSPISQLSQVVGGGKEMPIKAYVTSKDVLDSIDEYNRNVNASAI